MLFIAVIFLIEQQKVITISDQVEIFSFSTILSALLTVSRSPSMKKANSLNLWLLLAIAVSIGSIGIQQYLPKKSISVVPTPTNLDSTLFVAAPEGSNTRIEWLDQKNYSWRCTSEAPDGWLVCSSSIRLVENMQKGLNLSSYSTINIKVNYTGPARKMRVVLRNFDRRLSPDDENTESFKFQFVILRAEDFNHEVTVNLNEFTVSDWWIDQFDLPRELTRPDLSNVVFFGVEFIEGLPPGNHDVTIEKLSFSGELISAEKLYLGILGVWILAALVIVAIRIISLSRQTQLATQKITELAVSNNQLQTEKSRFQTLSNLDALTGIYNRYAIDKSIAQLLADPRKNSIALIIVDIDHFKRVNDRRGHDVGDNILKKFTLIVSNNIRNEDVFGRWGGEEFILICPQTTIENAFQLAEKIRCIINDTPFEEEKPLTITASFGVGTIQPDEDFAAAFKRVDAALYKAKSLGRNCTIVAEV